MAKAVEEDPDWEAGLQQLRFRVMHWPHVIETLTFGNPTFKVGKKNFAVLDTYKGEGCVWIRAHGERRAELLAAPAYFPSPYDPKKLALCCALKGIDWDQFTPVLAQSYEDSL